MKLNDLPPFDLVICTYNRPESVARLTAQVHATSHPPQNTIIVDSSDVENVELKKADRVTYVRSSHKNQPYQRFLGYSLSTADVVVFLDDDLEVVDLQCFEVMLSRYRNLKVRGVSVGFDHQHGIGNKVESFSEGSSLLFSIINFISGVPRLKTGKIYMAGLAGPKPAVEGPVESFNGAIMSFYRKELDHLFDPALFALFEKKLGMGEDKVISMKIGLEKMLWYVPGIYFRHPPVDSHYFQSMRQFQRKVTYSRLYISQRYGDIKHRYNAFVYLHYYYFSFWRILIGLGRLAVKPKLQYWESLRGAIDGIILTFRVPFDAERLTPGIDWRKDADRDTKRTR